MLDNFDIFLAHLPRLSEDPRLEHVIIIMMTYSKRGS